MFSNEIFPCPCCGYRVFTMPPGYHGICPICHWEDNLVQLRFPQMPGAANRVSLQDAQRNFQQIGAADRLAVNQVRTPDDADLPDPQWRPLDETRDNIEQPQRGIGYADSYPDDTTVLYYWRDTYWRRLAS
jgi:hypothetical protein